MRDETVVADGHKLTDERVRLDPAAFPNLYAFLNLHERTNKAFVADLTSVKIDRLDNRHVLSKPDIYDAGATEIGIVYQERKEESRKLKRQTNEVGKHKTEGVW